jgi:hypothetical protein
MPLHAILNDDRTAVRLIQDFPEGTVFKPGLAFPVVFEDMPEFNLETQTLDRVVSMPDKGVVKVSWAIVPIPKKDLDEKAKKAEVEGYYAELKTLRVKLDGSEKISEEDRTAILARLIDILMANENQKL